MRKGWDALKPGYRSRLEKAGVSRKAYESGASLRKGRGHEHTPERPTSYNPSEYPRYAQDRARLVRAVQTRKRQVWGDRPRWHEARSARALREHPPSMQQLRWALAADNEEILSALLETPKTHQWLFYH